MSDGQKQFPMQVAVMLMRHGSKVKRADWDLASGAFMTISECNNVTSFVITGEFYNSPQLSTTYSLTYDDYSSECWVEVE